MTQLPVDDDLSEFIENLVDKEYSSKSKAAAALLAEASELRESEYDDLDELLAAAYCVDDLEAELEHQEARADDLRRQLQATNAKDKLVQELAQYKKRTACRTAVAGGQATGKDVFGMPSEEQLA